MASPVQILRKFSAVSGVLSAKSWLLRFYFEMDSANWFAVNSNVEEDDWVLSSGKGVLDEVSE